MTTVPDTFGFPETVYMVRWFENKTNKRYDTRYYTSPEQVAKHIKLHDGYAYPVVHTYDSHKELIG